MSELFKYINMYVVVDSLRTSDYYVGIGSELKEAVGNLENVGKVDGDREAAKEAIQRKFGVVSDTLLKLAENVQPIEVEVLSDMGLKILFDIGMSRKEKKKKSMN